MHPTNLLIPLAAVLVALAAASCGSDDTPSGAAPALADGGGGGGDAGDGGTKLGTSCDGGTVGHADSASCSLPRAVGIAADGGAAGDGGFVCASDSDCTGGENGRCGTPSGNIAGPACSYDQCITDSDCGAMSACYCGTRTGNASGRNICVASECASDADCGAGFTCALSEDFACGSYGGVEGYFCHSAKDDCLNDCDCATTEGDGQCRYDTTAAHWSCSTSVCAG